MKTTPQFLLALVALLFAHPGAAQPTSGTSAKSTQSAKEEGGKSTLRRSSRMEFDGRLVKGERAAGAVYLFQRAPRRLPPLLRLKRDQLDRIVLPVLKRPADPASYRLRSTSRECEKGNLRTRRTAPRKPTGSAEHPQEQEKRRNKG